MKNTRSATVSAVFLVLDKSSAPGLIPCCIFLIPFADTFRKWKESNPEQWQTWLEKNRPQAAAYAAMDENAFEEEASKIKVGDRCELPAEEGFTARRGEVKYVGRTDFAKGYWIGVQLDEPMGKNDGSVKGSRFFTCPPKYGVFVQPTKVNVGDYPEKSLEDELAELDEL